MRLCVLLIHWMLVGPGYADKPLTVIYDSGDTLPIEHYLPKNKREKGTSNKKPMLPFKLPITTPSMRLGRVSVAAKTLKHLQQPLFLVGADVLSKSWLIKKREALKKVGAVGLLIHANDIDDINAMQEIADGLRLVPVSAEGIATELGLTHYPVLISKQGIEQ